jgi:elongation factor G
LTLPGLDDFSGGLITALRPADSALMLINGQHGVEIGTEIQGRHLESHNKPVILAVNQLDHDKANFEKVIESLKQSYGSKAVIVQYPVNPGESFNSIVDVVKMKMYKYPADGGKPEITGYSRKISHPGLKNCEMSLLKRQQKMMKA